MIPQKLNKHARKEGFEQAYRDKPSRGNAA